MPSTIPANAPIPPDEVTIAATAGNVTKNVAVGAYDTWKLLFMRLTIVCDATVADRYIQVYLTDGTNICVSLPVNTTAITANQTKIVSFYIGSCVGYGGAGNDHAHLPIAENILKGGYQIRIIIGNGAAGDSFSGFAIVERTYGGVA